MNRNPGQLMLIDKSNKTCLDVDGGIKVLLHILSTRRRVSRLLFRHLQSQTIWSGIKKGNSNEEHGQGSAVCDVV